jgi:hypothetical protein
MSVVPVPFHARFRLHAFVSHSKPIGVKRETMNPTHDQLILEQLLGVFAVASEQAFLSTLEAIAAKAGIETLDAGMSIRELFYQQKAEQTEKMICDFADFNPTGATHVKELYELLQINGEPLLG